MKKTLFSVILSVILFGALYSNVSMADSPPTPAKAWVILETHKAWVTAYASVPEETDDTPFITATGDTVHDGIIATNFLPIGTQVQIPSLFGDKVFTVDDRMAPKRKTYIDIWMSSVREARIFGIHAAKILVVKEVREFATSQKN